VLLGFINTRYELSKEVHVLMGFLSTDIFCTKLPKVTNNLRLRFFDIIYELIWVGDLETEQYLDFSVIS
jgi:hypothetical protein